MRKVFKVLGIILLVIVILVVILFIIASRKPFVPNNYTEIVKTEGKIETKYLNNGKYDVGYYEAATMSSFKKFEIFYPKDINNMGKLPVVVFVNGTGAVGSKYKALQKHMASWGFITIATEEENAWNGFSAEMCVRFLELADVYEDEKNENILKGHIDMDRIGITGHSQGGIGVINALTEQRHASIYKAAVLLSSAETEMAKALLWDSDSSKINTNTLMFSSTGKTDSAISPLEGISKTYESITDNVSKIMARRNDCDHGEMLYYADGYVTAWFMYYLQNDEEAGKVFAKNGELANNSLYQDVQTNIQ